jgi:hypothetical protein
LDGVARDLLLPQIDVAGFDPSNLHLALESYQIAMTYYVYEENNEVVDREFSATSEPFIIARREVSRGIHVTSPTPGQYLKLGHVADIHYELNCPQLPENIIIVLSKLDMTREGGVFFLYREELYRGAPHPNGQAPITIRSAVGQQGSGNEWRIYIKNATDDPSSYESCCGYSGTVRVGW